MTVHLYIVWPDGSTTTDKAFGNTPRAARAAAESLAHSYRLDGATVEIGKASERTYQG
jgi:hypothetical protein